MKKIAEKVLTFMLIFCMAVSFTAYAEDEILTVTSKFDVENNKLIVEGSVKSNKGNIPVVMMVMYGDTLIDAQQIVAGAAVDSTVSFTFDGVQFKNTTASGDYSIYVSAGLVGQEKTIVFSYDGIDKRFNLLKSVNDAIIVEDNDAIIAAIENNKMLICSGDEALFSLGKAAQDKFAELIIASGVYSLPESYASDADVNVIMESLTALSQDYTELLSSASALDIKDEATLDAWLAKYAESKGFFADDEETAYSEAVLGDYFKEVKSESALYERLEDVISEHETFKELRAGMLTAGILTLLEEAGYYKLSEVTESLKELFKVDWDTFEELNDSKQAEVYQSLTAENFENIEAYIDAFDAAVEEQKNKKSSGGSGGSSGGSSGGRTMAVVPQVNNAMGTTNGSTEGAFSDIVGFEWAGEAIAYLSDKKVISGRDDGSFDPAAQVTRAEFLKMIALAFNVSNAGYNGEFADVAQGSWYAPYVAAACKAGIVNGIDENNFMPNSPITRQDMIVILYRAKNISPSDNEKDVFVDSEQISGYAKSAAFAMYEKGIVSGDGDGTLNPLRNANRAEAAQMIYRTITVLN